MIELIDKGLALLLAIVFGLIGVVASLITNGSALLAEEDINKRKKLAWGTILNSLPQSICLSTFSFDIWALTLLVASDTTTLQKYNLTDKGGFLQLILVLHIFLYISVLAWGGMIRSGTSGNGETEIGLDFFLSIFALIMCIILQVS